MFYLKAHNYLDYVKWKDNLSYTISQSNGFLKKLSMELYLEDIGKVFEFWRFMRITEQSFLLQAEVGDMLLCQKSGGQGLTGVVDMVGIVIKMLNETTNTEDVFILRHGSSVMSPIVLQTWLEFRILMKGLKFKNCWYRHLHCSRDEDVIQNTEYFLQDILYNPLEGKSPEELKNPKNLKLLVEQSKKMIKSAELAAKFYRAMGVMDREILGKADNKLEPKDFS